MALLMVMLAINLVACGDDKEDGDKEITPSIVGTWKIIYYLVSPMFLIIQFIRTGIAECSVFRKGNMCMRVSLIRMKNLKHLGMALLMVMLAINLVACGDDKEDGDNIQFKRRSMRHSINLLC